MSIGAVGVTLPPPAQLVQSQPATTTDVDGDNDGSHAGEVESAEGNTGTPNGTLGSIINVHA